MLCTHGFYLSKLQRAPGKIKKDACKRDAATQVSVAGFLCLPHGEGSQPGNWIPSLCPFVRRTAQPRGGRVFSQHQKASYANSFHPKELNEKKETREKDPNRMQQRHSGLADTTRPVARSRLLRRGKHHANLHIEHDRPD